MADATSPGDRAVDDWPPRRTRGRIARGLLGWTIVGILLPGFFLWPYGSLFVLAASGVAVFMPIRGVGREIGAGLLIGIGLGLLGLALLEATQAHGCTDDWDGTDCLAVRTAVAGAIPLVAGTAVLALVRRPSEG